VKLFNIYLGYTREGSDFTSASAKMVIKTLGH
jgi:hypothetical protein